MGLFASANPEDVSYDTVSARTLLDRGAERIRTDLADQPYVQAQLMADMADIYRRLAVYDQSDALLADALPLVPATGTAADTTRADLLEYRGVSLRDLNRYDEAEVLHRFGVRDPRVDCSVPITGAPLPACTNSGCSTGRWTDCQRPRKRRSAKWSFHRAQVPIDTPYVASALNNLGLTYWYSDSLQQSPGDAFRVGRPAPAYFGRHVKSTSPLLNLGNVNGELGDEVEELRLKRLAYDIRRDALGPDHPSTASAQAQVAGYLLDDGQTAEALAMLEEAEAVYRTNLGDHSTNGSHHAGSRGCSVRVGRDPEALRGPANARDMAYRTFTEGHRALR